MRSYLFILACISINFISLAQYRNITDLVKNNIKGKPSSVSVKTHNMGTFFETKYNKDGNITFTENIVEKVENTYNSDGKIKTKISYSRLYDGKSIAYTVNYFYKNNLLDKELYTNYFDPKFPDGITLTGKYSYFNDRQEVIFYDDNNVIKGKYIFYYDDDSKINFSKEIYKDQYINQSVISEFNNNILTRKLTIDNGSSYSEELYDNKTGNLKKSIIDKNTLNYSYIYDNQNNIKEAIIKNDVGTVIGKDIWKITYYE